jgi:S1-C subfamily serine protease
MPAPFRILLPVLLALTILAPSSGATLLPSVMPLRAEIEGVERTFCTAFAINEQEHLWATAKHCVEAALDEEWEMRIGGGFAYPIYLTPGGDDVAVIQAERAGEALSLAFEAPSVGQAIRIQGYPYGLPIRVTVTGTLAGRMLPIAGQFSDVLDINVAGGNSGSPVMNEDGRVIGVLWGRFVQSSHALAVPWETLQRLISGYFGS